MEEEEGFVRMYSLRNTVVLSFVLPCLHMDTHFCLMRLSVCLLYLGLLVLLALRRGCWGFWRLVRRMHGRTPCPGLRVCCEEGASSVAEVNDGNSTIYLAQVCRSCEVVWSKRVDEKLNGHFACLCGQVERERRGWTRSVTTRLVFQRRILAREHRAHLDRPLPPACFAHVKDKPARGRQFPPVERLFEAHPIPTASKRTSDNELCFAGL